MTWVVMTEETNQSGAARRWIAEVQNIGKNAHDELNTEGAQAWEDVRKCHW